VDSNLCISESEFATTLSLGGGIRTSASRNQICGRSKATKSAPSGFALPGWLGSARAGSEP
jgi:hypothetical protein